LKPQPAATGPLPATAPGKRPWLYAFAAGILTVLLVEFAISAMSVEQAAAALVLGLPAGGTVVVLFLLARKHWLPGFLACVAFVFFLWICIAALMTGPWLLGLAGGLASVAVLILVLKKCYLPDGFRSAFLFVHLAVFGASALVTIIMPESYLSTARVDIQRNVDQGVTNAFPRASAFYDPWFIQTEFEVIQSELILGKVVKDLDLTETWGQRYGRGRALTQQEALLLLKRSLDLRPVRTTSLIEIRGFSEQPEEAAAIANKVAEDFQRYERTASSLESSPSRVSVQIIDRAEPGLRPARPNKPMNVSIGALAGLLLGTLAGNAFAGYKERRRPLDTTANTLKA
jgi:capsular polysaccharide biosynthesis protein